MQWSIRRELGVVIGVVGAAAAAASAGPVRLSYSQPTLDRWMYPFNSNPGGRTEASTFGSILIPGFDDRDAEWLVGYDTGADVPPGLGAANYGVSRVRLHVWISEGDRFVYDPTFDSVRTSFDPSNPNYTPDLDPGKPIELFGCGYRNGYGAVTTQTTTAFCQDCPFGGDPVVPPAEGARNVFPAIFDSQGVATDVSRQVRQEIEATPLAVGVTTTVQPGQLVPANTEFVFDVDLCQPGARAYIQRALDQGRLNLLVTSLHPVSGPTSTEYPVFYTKFNAIATTLGYTAKLELTVNRGARADFDSNGMLNINDFIAFQAAFAAQDPGADVDDSCSLNVNDFVVFQQLFAAGR